MWMTDKYKKQKNFSKEWVLTRNWMPYFEVFNSWEYKFKHRFLLSLIYEFELHDKDFDLTTKEISKLMRMSEITVKRYVALLIKQGVLTAEKTGRTRKLKLTNQQ